MVAAVLDGFVLLDASCLGGWITMPPLRCKGDVLGINPAASALGELRVEVQDEWSIPSQGFRLDRARTLLNDVAARVDSRESTDVSTVANRVIRLKIVMRSARLCAFQFRNSIHEKSIPSE